VPSFTVEIPNMQADGPLVELRIAVGGALEATLRAAGNPIPSPIPALAMIDTGATRSVIRQGLTTQLGLNPVGLTHINTPTSTNVPCYEYLVRLVFPNNLISVEGTFIEAPLQGQNIQFLIGRDVLSRGVLIYIGYRNLFTLSF
jgi:hypothetical protein